MAVITKELIERVPFVARVSFFVVQRGEDRQVTFTRCYDNGKTKDSERSDVRHRTRSFLRS